RMLRIVKKLRQEERYNGYIHLKTIPGASEELIKEAGLYVDRMSINLELPTEAGLKLVAPEKDHESVKKPLAFVKDQIASFKEELITEAGLLYCLYLHIQQQFIVNTNCFSTAICS